MPISKNLAAAGRLQTSFLRLTFATFKSLFLLSLKTVAKLTLCATGGKKIGGGLEVYIVLSTVWRLRRAGSPAPNIVLSMTSLKIPGIYPKMHGNTGEIAQQNNRHPAHVECEGIAFLDLSE